MPSLRRRRKTADLEKDSSSGATSDGPKVQKSKNKAQLAMTLDEFVLAHKLSSSAENALRSKSEEVIQRILSQGPLEGGNANLALAARLWAEQADYSEQHPAQQVNSERQVNSVAQKQKWNRWFFAKSSTCLVGKCDPCMGSVVDLTKTVTALKDGKDVQHSDAACGGHAKARHAMVRTLNKNTSKDYPEAVECYTRAAEQGDAEAQFKLGVCYANGDGVGKDSVCAVHWYELAAKQGMVEAQFNLGLCYKNGAGVTQDLKLALEWFTKACKKAHLEAQFNVALCYQCGDGVNVDATKAASWFKKAASKGHSRSQFELGLCHSRGLGVPREFFFAFIMFKAAALNGLDVAEYKLAVCYHKGTGVEKDMEAAIAWYTKAAEQGHSKAQYTLAVCYLTGDGVPIDVQLGWTWLQRAAEQGHPAAIAELED